MVCSACGAPINPGARFCANCGAQLQQAAPAAYAAAPLPAQPRVGRHLQTLGILWLVFGGYSLVLWLVALPFLAGIFGGMGHMHYGMHGFPFNHPWFMGWIPFITAIIIVRSALSLLVGFALLTRQPWGRVLAIVVGILSLLKLPFGTALGIYTLWVLAPAQSGVEYGQIAV
ncbi:MAG: zinc ribbon domain-containing protein [Acidobacteriaceae bacterium]